MDTAKLPMADNTKPQATPWTPTMDTPWTHKFPATMDTGGWV